MSPPSSLKVTKASHAIKKPSKRSAIKSPSSISSRDKPVIIYTYSPKIIHTTADKFKSVVQKLTGCEISSLPDLNDNGACENFKVEEEISPAMEHPSFSYTQLLTSTIGGSLASADALGFDYSAGFLFHDFAGFI